MKRLILLVILGLLTASLAFAGQPSTITKISLPGFKSIEGGIAVNPVTHKAYVIAELATEGADDQKVIFVLDDDVLNAQSAPEKLNLPLGSTSHPPKVIPIANENEYITIDSTRNLIYVATKFDVAEEESDNDNDGGDDEVESSGDLPTPALAAGSTLGTLTVIDGNTDTVIATWEFPEGVEPEGVAVDTVNSIVYVAGKAPEGESSVDDVCNPWATPIPDVGEPDDVECWTAGSIYAFFIDPTATPIITYLKAIPAGDDPESIVFENGMVYAANEDDGTVTIARAVYPDGSGGELLTDLPRPPTQPYSLGIAPYSLGVFYDFGPNPKACRENKFEADKMAAGGGSVFITDDRSRVAKITVADVVDMVDIAGASKCLEIPNTDGGGANTANNIAFMQRGDRQLLYVVSEQNTVAIYDPATMNLKATITIPEAQHLDGIAVDGAANRVWITDEVLQAVFVLKGACANGTGQCVK